MGRGLSELQLWILKAASEAPFENTSLGSERILSYKDIYMGYYGWKPKYPGAKYQYGDYHLFDRQQIGVKRHRQVLVTVHKSVYRLRERGLIELYVGCGVREKTIKLTDKGIELLVNRARLSRQVSH